MRTYDPARLTPHDPRSPAWALAWARRLSGDVPPWRPGSLTDAEWQGWLDLTAVRHNGTTYYRPHEAAAQWIESDPNRMAEWTLMGTLQRFRDPAQAAAAIRRLGVRFDRLIADLTGVNPGLRELTSRW